MWTCAHLALMWNMKKRKKNGCCLKNVGHINKIFHVHMLGAYVHVNILWSNMWPGGMATDDANNIEDDNDDNNTRRTIHDCLGSFAFMPNEPIMAILPHDTITKVTCDCVRLHFFICWITLLFHHANVFLSFFYQLPIWFFFSWCNVVQQIKMYGLIKEKHLTNTQLHHSN